MSLLFKKSLLFVQMGYLIFINLGQQNYCENFSSGFWAHVLVQLQLFVFMQGFFVCFLCFFNLLKLCSKDFPIPFLLRIF